MLPVSETVDRLSADVLSGCELVLGRPIDPVALFGRHPYYANFHLRSGKDVCDGSGLMPKVESRVPVPTRGATLDARWQHLHNTNGLPHGMRGLPQFTLMEDTASKLTGVGIVRPMVFIKTYRHIFQMKEA